MPESDSNVPSFHGEHRYGVDGSRRVMIPAKWRPRDKRTVFTSILWPIGVEEFLLVLPPARWQTMLDNLKTRSLHDKRIATLERVIGATSAPLVLDKVWRFCLPESLAAAAGIDKEAQLIGRLDKFEIWTPARYQAGVAQDKAVAAEVAGEIL